MTPRLIAISGKMKGTVFALGKKEANIGREMTNAICLNDPSVSRQHCLIKQNDEGLFFIRDLESFNGVFVNGTPVNEQEIKHGDQLGIGDVMMFFLLREAEDEAVFHQNELTLIQDDTLDNKSTIKLQRKDAVYFSPENLLAELPQMARVAHGLSTLLQITSAFDSIRDLESLQQLLLELTMKAIPAERGVILLLKEDEREINSYYAWSSDPKNSKHIRN
jgi:adenylate cyclase